VHGAFYPPADYEAVVSRLAARREVTLVGVDQWEGRETRVYRLSRR
jgi:hypothetical protein